MGPNLDIACCLLIADIFQSNQLYDTHFIYKNIASQLDLNVYQELLFAVLQFSSFVFQIF